MSKITNVQMSKTITNVQNDYKCPNLQKSKITNVQTYKSPKLQMSK